MQQSPISLNSTQQNAVDLNDRLLRYRTPSGAKDLTAGTEAFDLENGLPIESDLDWVKEMLRRGRVGLRRTANCREFQMSAMVTIVSIRYDVENETCSMSF